MSLADRVRHPAFLERVMSAEEAAKLIPAGANVGMSGFTGAGHPKAVPQAIAAHAKAEHAAGKPYKINLWTGASTAPELDGALAQANALGQRLLAEQAQQERDYDQRTRHGATQGALLTD